jgi:hypothetical protein
MADQLTLPIQVGKKYVRRNGETVVVTSMRGLEKALFFTNESSTFGDGYVATGRCLPGQHHPFDLVVDYIEPAVGHPQAGLMALYAEDAAKTAEPWLLWEWRQYGDDSSWRACTVGVRWFSDMQYRRKPVTKKVWVNLYTATHSPGALGPKQQLNGFTHDTKEAADAMIGNPPRLACVEIEIPA